MLEKLKLRRKQDRGIDTGCSKGLRRLDIGLCGHRFVMGRVVVMLRNVCKGSSLWFELRGRRGFSGEEWLDDVVAKVHASRHKIGKVILHLRVAFGSRESAL